MLNLAEKQNTHIQLNLNEAHVGNCMYLYTRIKPHIML